MIWISKGGVAFQLFESFPAVGNGMAECRDLENNIRGE